MKFVLMEGKVVPQSLLSTVLSAETISALSEIPHPPTNIHYPFNPELQKLLQGKQLLLDDLPSNLTEIQEHYENGYITLRRGITFYRNKPKCERCGNQDPAWFATFPCARCEEVCTYCRKCIMMGRISRCTPLYGWIDVAHLSQAQPIPFAWTGTLSPGQQIASDRVVDAIADHKELLVWAVCGAGKTEVLFQGIHNALSKQKRVCIATPRTDVVIELTPRLQTVFPSITVASLYGGTEDRHINSELTITTTHQLLRFYKAFDTVIVDEVDAFPYSVDETLQFAVIRARKPQSSMIYLSATPSSEWQKECRQGKRDYVTIPARFHRHALPVPQFVWCGNWQKQLKKNNLPSNVMKWLKERLQAKKQTLFFIPKINLIPKILPHLQNLNPNIEAVHAEDPNRKEKVQAMRNKEILILVTTTILERGVTFPNLDVAVLGAEERIFTESALVQIAGRVGRSARYPAGEITFFHYGKTDAMIKARTQIQTMNREAWKKGLIDHE